MLLRIRERTVAGHRAPSRSRSQFPGSRRTSPRAAVVSQHIPWARMRRHYDRVVSHRVWIFFYCPRQPQSPIL
jgi:hypothetical protein